MVRVPPESAGRSRDAVKDAAKLNSANSPTTLSCLAGGTTTAMNIPNSATLSALTTRVGSRFPAMTPTAVPVAQQGIATR